MASSSSNPNNNNALSPSTYDPSPPANNTTFVQADPSTFRAVVQKLTGATAPPELAGKYSSGDIGPRRPPFKLHERRQSVAGARKLEIKLSRGSFGIPFGARAQTALMASSPVSTLDTFARGSPRTPPANAAAEEEAREERAIAEKGFYLHRSPLSTPRGGAEPELLPLFPLHSPRD